MLNVGKYSGPMGHMGMVMGSFFWRYFNHLEKNISTTCIMLCRDGILGIHW